MIVTLIAPCLAIRRVRVVPAERTRDLFVDVRELKDVRHILHSQYQRHTTADATSVVAQIAFLTTEVTRKLMQRVRVRLVLRNGTTNANRCRLLIGQTCRYALAASPLNRESACQHLTAPTPHES
jgi:hypothetical protein